jgi:hypothetical protein
MIKVRYIFFEYSSLSKLFYLQLPLLSWFPVAAALLAFVILVSFLLSSKILKLRYLGLSMFAWGFNWGMYERKWTVVIGKRTVVNVRRACQRSRMICIDQKSGERSSEPPGGSVYVHGPRAFVEQRPSRDLSELNFYFYP